MTNTSQNGWPLIPPQTTKPLRRFVIPDVTVRVLLRDGSAGFLLCHWAMVFNAKIENLNTGQADEWGYSYRPIVGSDEWSNHASGTAADLNSTKHPYGVSGTYTRRQRWLIRARLRYFYRGCIRAGEFYNNPDGMHFELDRDLATCEKRARKLIYSKRGQRLLKVNPGLMHVILS